MESAVVIGGAGFVGSNLCRQLASQGVKVTSLDNYSTGSESNHVAGVEYIRGDCRQIGDHPLPRQVEAVFHLGEYSRVEQSDKEPMKALAGTVGTIIPVIEYCHASNAKLIYSGSSTKFGDADSPYSIGKAANTRIVHDACSYLGIDFAVTYFYNVYGEGEIESGAYSTVVAKFLRAWRLGESVTVRSPGTQVRNFTHVADIVSGLVAVAERGHGDGYGIGASQSYSIIDLADMIGVKWSLGDPSRCNRMSAELKTKRTKELGWTQTVMLSDYIAQAKQEVAHGR